MIEMGTQERRIGANKHATVQIGKRHVPGIKKKMKKDVQMDKMNSIMRLWDGQATQQGWDGLEEAIRRRPKPTNTKATTHFHHSTWDSTTGPKGSEPLHRTLGTRQWGLVLQAGEGLLCKRHFCDVGGRGMTSPLTSLGHFE